MGTDEKESFDKTNRILGIYTKLKNLINKESFYGSKTCICSGF